MIGELVMKIKAIAEGRGSRAVTKQKQHNLDIQALPPRGPLGKSIYKLQQAWGPEDNPNVDTVWLTSYDVERLLELYQREQAKAAADTGCFNTKCEG